LDKKALFKNSPDENKTEINYSKGLFVVNQGVFQSGTGTITFHNDIDTIKDAFTAANPDKVLGNIAQSMIRFDNKYFIAINNGAKIQVVDGISFKSLGEISKIEVPRYFTATSDKLYVSAWGADFKSGAVFEINPKTLTLSNTINTGGAPENMIVIGDKLYVVISTVTDKSNKMVIIDTKTNKIINTITVRDNPSSIQVDKNGAIWVLCGGNSDWNIPALSTKGSLVRIINDKVDANYELSNGANSLVIDKNKQKLYFLMDAKVFVHDISDTSFKKQSIADGYFYTLGYHSTNDRLYMSDAGDFQSDGVVKTINLTTKTESSFKAGIIPGFFYFVD
jgi:DNA-binding beta-propeller fold protein YncE